MFMRQVLPSSPGESRGAGSQEPRREPPPGQSTWSTDTLRALFPRLPGSMSSECLLTGRTRTPLEGCAAHSHHSFEPGDAYTALAVGAQMIRHLCLYENTEIATAQFHMSLFKRGEAEVEDETATYFMNALYLLRKIAKGWFKTIDIREKKNALVSIAINSEL